MKLPRITLKWMRRQRACWPDTKLLRYFPDLKRGYDPFDFIDICEQYKLSAGTHALWLACCVYRDVANSRLLGRISNEKYICHLLYWSNRTYDNARMGLAMLANAHWKDRGRS